ncbi:MAG: hypothetical protein Ct9H300mP1_08600 [Planctomycetaceae bacterium]|nr:MAG: hypothetical protein Ct9H300mP1_08600 [Planctomycetaceae bacterium]
MNSNCLLSTVYQRFGVNTEPHFFDNTGRPVPILTDGKPIASCCRSSGGSSLELCRWSLQVRYRVGQSESVGDAIEEANIAVRTPLRRSGWVQPTSRSATTSASVVSAGSSVRRLTNSSNRRCRSSTSASSRLACSSEATTKLSSSCNCRKWAWASVQYSHLFRAET